MGEPRLRNRVSAANAMITDVIAQPCMRSVGPKSPTGARGPGLMTGTGCSVSMGGAVT